MPFNDRLKEPSHLGAFEPFLADSDDGRTGVTPDRQSGVEVSIERDGHSVVFSTPHEDRLVVGC